RWLKYRSNIATSILTDRQGTFNGLNSSGQFGSSWQNRAAEENNFNRYLNWDNILTFNESFGDHNIEATAVSTWVQSIDEKYSMSGTNQFLDSFLFYSLQSTDASNRSISSGYTSYQTLGFAGRLSYNYLGKYLLTATGRWDGSSVLASGHRWSFFPSVSAAWRISDEAFMESTRNRLSNLKLRLSYGTSGNAAIPPYSTPGGFVSSNTRMAFNDTPAVAYQFGYLVGNPQLGWEISQTNNVGIDAGFLNNRISLTVDLYNINTGDILKSRDLLPSSGAGGSGSQQFQTYQNICETNNKGLEIALTSENFTKKDLRWTTTLTFATNKEKIVKLITDNDIIAGSNVETQSLLIGRPINSFYSYRLLGVWQLGEESEMAKYKLNGEENKIKPGDLKIEDFNGDGNINTADRQYLGSRAPKWIAGLNNTLYFKGFDLNVYLFARWGQMINAEFLGRFDPAGVKNSPDYIDYWTPENPAMYFPQPYKDRPIYDYYGYMSLNYVDGSYFKVKNLSLGYTLPKSITGNWGIEKLRFYATASNVLTVAKSDLIKHYDPERGGSETMPLTKQMVFGVSVNF
ncbi:MAG: SusC/RagA family TonB-linked outer membrane protein, partial [Dysgonamonadaceae bacterium]|nr:SusC/RagA family TonB-linked outer membrane protein [Dysgonamonadaceae bacterium]